VASAHLLASGNDVDSEQFARCESVLVDLAERLSVRELRGAIERWRAHRCGIG
jgi:hypothetical protein